MIEVRKIHHDISYLYNTNMDCASSNCDEICRCSTISNIRINEILTSVDCISLGFTNGSKRKPKLSDIDKYCIKRLMLLNGIYDKDQYSVSVVQGYYGEELGEPEFHNDFLLTKNLNELFKLTDMEKVMFVLQKEYHFIAPILQNVTSCEVANISISDVKHSAGASMMKKQYEYAYSLKDDNEPIGIVLERDSGNLLIDGNHRLSYTMTKEDTDVKKKFIVLS